MDVTLSIALDQTPQRRDIEVWAGDDFQVLLNVYASDVDDGALPVDLTGKTVTLKLANYVYPSLTVTAPGAAQTALVFVPNNTANSFGRMPYVISMKDNTSGKTQTLCQGALIVRNQDVQPVLGGNDYGWGYWPAVYP